MTTATASDPQLSPARLNGRHQLRALQALRARYVRELPRLRRLVDRARWALLRARLRLWCAQRNDGDVESTASVANTARAALAAAAADLRWAVTAIRSIREVLNDTADAR